MSLIDILKKKCKIDFFTTPSHSQNFFIFPKFKQFYKYDISETDAYEPQKALKLAAEKAAKIYGTKSTHFLTNGSTSGILAAVLACIKPGEKVLIWDNAHPCHKNAVKLAGAIPVFYKLEKDKDWDIYGGTPPEIIEEKLKEVNTIFNHAPSPPEGEGWGGGYKTTPIKAVIITSPTYEGMVSDVAKIKGICKKYGAYLIVDEAHGALYPFCDKLPTSAIYSSAPPLNPPPQVGGKTNYFCNYEGADFVIQSLHKTAGGLNPTALLHCNINFDEGDPQEPPRPLRLCRENRLSIDSREVRVGVRGIKSALDLISTTSPSYPLLASIEKNINFLNSKKGRKKILELIENIENMKKKITDAELPSKPNLNQKSRLGLITQQQKTSNALNATRHSCEFYKNNDPTKILVKVPNLSGFELSEILFEKYKIEDEIANEKSIMLLCGIGTDLKKLKRLEKILKKF